MTWRPCVDCGEPSPGTRCPDCTPVHERRNGSASERGYDSTWRRLSARARRLSPLCQDCGSVENLSTDHTPEAWQRKAEGKAIRLCDVAVLCARCQARRGPARGPRARTDHREGGTRPTVGTVGEAVSRLHNEVMPSRQALYGAVGPTGVRGGLARRRTGEMPQGCPPDAA